MKHCLLFILFSYFFHLYQAFLFNGYQIKDLYTNDNDTFFSDLAYWTPTSVRHEVSYSVCGGYLLAAGFDVLGIPLVNGPNEGMNFRRTYNNLPDHNIIYYTISLYLIDSWDPTDFFQIEFDSVLVEGWSFGSGNFTGNFCGRQTWPDLMNMTIYGQISHSRSSVELKVVSMLDDWAYDESLGFRDVSLIFAKSPLVNVNERCGLSSLQLPTDGCFCPGGEYFDDIGIPGCQTCDSSCRSCFGGTSRDCYECQVGYSFAGEECILCDQSCAVCSGPKANQCVSCPEGMALLSDGTCVPDCFNTSISGTVQVCDQPCEADQFYFSENKTCSDDCNSPWLADPFMTGVQVCMNACPGGYIYWDGTCNSLCKFPMKTIELDYGVLLCDFPCGWNEVLFWDGSCGFLCDEPLLISFYKNTPFCQHPCAETTDFVYWNGSCGSDCPSPFVNSSDDKIKYCDLPCPEEQYWNGSACLESCSEPLRTREEGGINYCELPCPESSDYLYWNGSCIDSCPYKASVYGELGVKTCCYLCEQYGDYYYPVNGECLPTCDFPFTPEIQVVDDETWYVACLNKHSQAKFPPPVVDDDEEARNGEGPLYYPITAVRIASEKVAGVFMALDGGVSLLSDSHLMILILIIKILNYIKYMDIRLPPQLVQEFKTYDHNHFYLNFGPGMGLGMEEKFTRSNSLPMVFERAGLHSRFLVNFFKPISSFLIMLGFMIIIAVLKRIFRKKSAPILIKILLKRLETYFRWNLVVLLVICNIDEITLCSVIEWRTESIRSAQDFFSLIASLGMFFLAGVVVVAPFYLLNKIYNTRFKVLSNLANEPYFELLKKIEGFQVLWKDFKDSSGPQKAFMSIYILRIALVYLIVAVLYKHPLAQMILIFSMSLGMLIFMSIVKPFMKSLDFVQSVAYEVSMLISIGSTLLLAVLDYTHTRADQLWLFLGNVIQFCHILVTLTAVVIFVAKFAREMESIREFYRSLPKPITRQQFWVLVLEENDPIAHELKRNKRTSTKLDLTDLEKEIQKKNLSSYNVSVSCSSPDGSQSQSASMMDENRPIFTPTKVELKIRRSLFKIGKLCSEEEGSPAKTASTFDGDKSPTSVDSLKLPTKISSQSEIRKNPSDPSSEGENDGKSQKGSENITERKNESGTDTVQEKKVRWKGLETIKEVDSMEISRMKSGEQTKRLTNMLQDTLRGDLGLLNILNKKLSSETRQITEETVIMKEKEDLFKKRDETREEDTVQESMFE